MTRLVRGIDDWLAWGKVENDWTARTLDSYRRNVTPIVEELGDDITFADLDGRPGTEKLRRVLAKRWGNTSAGRRANVISSWHTLFEWAEDEGLVRDDPARRIKRPPRRRANVYRPPRPDIDLCYQALARWETAPWILMHRIGLRASTVCAARWPHVDLTYGWIDVTVKGSHEDRFPVPPDALEALRDIYRLLEPGHADYVFAPERELEHGNQGRRRVRDPKKPATQKTLWLMVSRVCDRAGVRRFGPHALRHAFATEFLRDSERDVMSLQKLMGHTKLETTRGYVDDLDREELEQAVRRAAARRASVRNPDNGEAARLRPGRNRFDGPGWNRTTGRPDPAGPPEGNGADGTFGASLDHRKGCHE